MKIALVGSGPASIGHMAGLVKKLKPIKQGMSQEEWSGFTTNLDLTLDIFDRTKELGQGIYSVEYSGVEHLLNIPDNALLNIEGKDAQAVQRFIHDPENQELIDNVLQKRFIERFANDFRRNFGEEYNQELKVFSRNPEDAYAEEEKENLRQKHIDYYSSVKGRYFDRVVNSTSVFLPRIIIGIFLQKHFEEVLHELQELIGPERIRLHPECEVVGAKVNNEESSCELRYNQAGQEFAETYNHVSIASGRFHFEEPRDNFDGRYISQIWPIENVENAIEQAKEKAREEGRSEVKILIKGSSVSAVDLVKTALLYGKFVEEDGKEIFLPAEGDVAVKADMISRNGLLPKIRTGQFAWSSGDYRAHYPKALMQVAQKYGIGKYSDEYITHEVDEPLRTEHDMAIRSYKKWEGIMNWEQVAEEPARDLFNLMKETNGGDKVHLWQVAKLFAEIMAQAYENHGLALESGMIRSFTQIIEENKDNYSEIQRQFISLQNPSAIEGLRTQLASLPNGGNDIRENITLAFFNTEAFALKENLSAEDNLFLSVNDWILNLYSIAMPKQSAHDLIAYHDAGVLNVRKIGYHTAPEKLGSDGRIAIDLGAGVEEPYDLILDSSGSRLRVKTTSSELYRSLYDSLTPAQQKSIHGNMPVVMCREEEWPEFETYLSQKFGEEFANLVTRNMNKDGEGNVVYDAGEIDFKSHEIIGNDGRVIATLMRKNFGIWHAMDAASKLSGKVFDNFLQNSPSPNATTMSGSTLANAERAVPSVILP